MDEGELTAKELVLIYMDRSHAFSEDKLISIAAAFEELMNARKNPRIS